MIKRIDHINIVVEDLENMKKFFVALGFKVDVEDSLEGEWISNIVGLPEVKGRYVKLSIPGNNMRIELLKYIHPPSGSDSDMKKANQLGFRHMAFEVEDIHETLEKIKALETTPVGKVTTYEKTGKQLIYFYGPENILLELAQYPKGK